MAVTMTCRTLFSLSLSTLLLAAASLSASFLVEADIAAGFTVELFHRDSPNSPFFNATESHFSRLTNLLDDSGRRVRQTNRSLLSTAQTSVASAVGSYLMKLGIGTPPVEIVALVDTANDFSWTPCKPCQGCDQMDPIFQPRASSTYRQVSCQDSRCETIGGYYCIADACTFQRDSHSPLKGAIATGSIIQGTVSMDTFTLGSTRGGQSLSFPNIVFGCFGSYVPSPDETGPGMVALGVGQNSLLSQIQDSIGGKFSYCLVPVFSKESGKMSFGGNAVLSGPDVVTTPLFLGSDPSISYLLNLEAISIGDVRLPFHTPPSSSPGNIVIDTGATMSYLPYEYLSRVEEEVDKLVYLRRENEDSPPHMCYKSFSDIDAPPITLHFTGADVKLSGENTFIRIDYTAVCFAFAGIDDNSYPFLGNLAQINHLVAYDIPGRTVSFKKADCTNY
ncbi:hypothetical protein Tsubulata_015012 [Turnera subulata]|uniref:Peptidase A1 domain-containing protein n=1 Tax=Turnera subulata TaxID=218843 RepID=A0A9Q0FJ26_9ROSI|nr:hypothetical protein Tsubulata_015012 [Turnera subulata]